MINRNHAQNKYGHNSIFPKKTTAYKQESKLNKICPHLRVELILLYFCETWVMREQVKRKL